MSTKASKWPGWLFLAASLFGFVYAAYSTWTQSGLCGYVIAFQMDVFGSADENLTTYVCGMLLMVLLILFFGVLDKVAPSLNFRASMASSFSSQRSGFNVLSWTRILIISAVPAVAGILIAFGLVLYGLHEQREAVQTIDLDSRPVVPIEVKYLGITGVAQWSVEEVEQRDYTDFDHHIFVPVTSTKWDPGQPVQYLVHYEHRTNGRDDKLELPSAFSERTPTLFRGKVSRALPVPVELKFKSNGLRMEPSYVVIDWENLPGDQYIDPYFGLGFGAGLGFTVSIFLFLILSAARWRRKSAAAG